MEHYSSRLEISAVQGRKRGSIRQAMSSLSHTLSLITCRELIETEAVELIRWLSTYYELRNTWPVNVIVERVICILDEGYLSENELIDLMGVLSVLDISSEHQTDARSKFDHDPNSVVAIPGNQFCFSGEFIYGSRERCRQAIVERGGHCSRQISGSLNYLVVGELESQQVVSASKEVDSAEQLQKVGAPIQIVPESLWVKSL